MRKEVDVYKREKGRKYHIRRKDPGCEFVITLHLPQQGEKIIEDLFEL
jgi:hypothetical protein